MKPIASEKAYLHSIHHVTTIINFVVLYQHIAHIHSHWEVKKGSMVYEPIAEPVNKDKNKTWDVRL